MTRPAIGLCAALERAQWGPWDRYAALLPFDYIEEIQRAGGLALMIPADPCLVEYPEEILDRLDGLILAGGADVNPALYADPDPQPNGTIPLRDTVELALTRAAIERDMPVLAICRGMQLLNVALGGTLVQHVPDEVGHDHHRRNVGTFDGNDHDVQLVPGSLAAKAAGELQHATKSHHHQSLAAIGDGLTVTGTSLLDHLPEAVELQANRFVLGVQWHPEADEQSRVLSALVDEARAYRSARGSE
jgi:putative glutamine amidotransferase